MIKINIVIWFVWSFLVIVWNYSYPSASPFLDVLVAVILSILNILILKFFIKK